MRKKYFHIFQKKYYLSILSKVIKFIIIIALSIICLEYFYKEDNRDITNTKIIDFEKNLKNITEEEIKEFRKINSENKLINNFTFTKSSHPDISIIITIYNQAHCIHKCIRSVQNQSLKNIEILLIDDCSTDNSTKIIEEFQKKDKRVILLSHDTNQGKIKSRADGIRLAKGKYITIIDGDDALIHQNILNNSLTLANLGKLDVVEFKALMYRQGVFRIVLNNFNIFQIKGVIYQPELRTKFFKIGNRINDRPIRARSICFKLIRNELFQLTLNRIGAKYTEDFINNYEDIIMLVTLYQIANSYYLMNDKGYYYSKDDKRGRFPSLKNKICKPNDKIKDMSQVKFLQYLVEKTIDNEIERQILYHEFISINYYINFVDFINHHYEMVYEVLDAMNKSSFIKISQKKILMKIKNDLMKKQNKKNITKYKKKLLFLT